MPNPAQLAGYLLEEVVAHLLLSSGYRLLTELDDPEVLVWRGNGLRVRGRGAQHQADGLGDLAITIPFSLPIRLFVEAKNTKEKVGLDVVRNAHGVVHDVNEFARAAEGSVRLHQLRRVQYRYSIFATGGFTRDAQEYALAHQISLIDLSGPAWGALARKLRQAADAVLRLFKGPDSGAVARRALREALRRMEPSFSGEVTDMPTQASNEVQEWARSLATSILRSDTGDGDIILGFVDAPFVLALRPNDSDAFRSYVARRGSPIAVHIGYDGRGPLGGEWVVQDSSDPQAFRLTFALPGVLEELLLAAAPNEVRQLASKAKKLLISTITVYVDGRPVLLNYERTAVLRSEEVAEDAHDTTELRQLLDPLDARGWSLDFEKALDSEPSAPWTFTAVAELLSRLEGQGYVQAELIRHAARQGGSITREDIYRLAGFDQGRSLRGLARPSNRIRRQLIDEGKLPSNVKYPFEAAYARGAVASSYEVPDEIAAMWREHGGL